MNTTCPVGAPASGRRGWRAAHPPLARSPLLWMSALTLAAGLALILHQTGRAPHPPTTLHVALPPLLLLGLLMHPRARGLAHYGRGTRARQRLRVVPMDGAAAVRHHRRLARTLAHGRLGPVWLRCAVAALLATLWTREMGWLRVEGSRWYPLTPDDRALSEGALLLAFGGALAALFATHLAVWERDALATRRARAGGESLEFWRALGRAIVLQLAAGLASLLFGLLTLFLLFLLLLVLAVLVTLEEPRWFQWVLGSARPRTELLLLALPGMLGRGWVELRRWREELELRVALLARELDGERGGGGRRPATRARARLSGAATAAGGP